MIDIVIQLMHEPGPQGLGALGGLTFVVTTAVRWIGKVLIARDSSKAGLVRAHGRDEHRAQMRAEHLRRRRRRERLKDRRAQQLDVGRRRRS